MAFEVIEESLNGLILFETKAYSDDRGFFMESWKMSQFEQFVPNHNFVQDNYSFSKKHVVRGLHFQWDKAMGKLLRVFSGSAKVVEVDIRYNSPTLGQVYSTVLSAENKRALWVPPGFANGFISLEDDTAMFYKCTAEWNPKAESGINPFDEKLDINWNVGETISTEKDRLAQTLEEWLLKPESKNFKL